MIGHLGRESLMKILPDLPEVCQDQLQGIQDRGWNCGFYLGVFQNKMYFCMAAHKDGHQHLIAADDSTVVVDRLYSSIVGST